MEKQLYKYFYNGVNISKRDYELIQFIQTGSNELPRAYWISEHRKPRFGDLRFYASWFNRSLKRIQNKGLLKEIPFAYRANGDCWVWANPGINASKANFECVTLHDAQMELKSEMNKII